MILCPRGTKDMLPSIGVKWQAIEAVEREEARVFGFREIRTPIFEHTELFQRGVGDTTDVVQKEMYTFLDKGGRSITLKPEGTAGVVRAFIENGLFNEPLPQKLCYISTPIFRYEAPQAGRLRQHHQFGVEVLGAADATADAEIIQLAMNIVGKLGLHQLTLHINSIGCPKCRPVYRQLLTDWLRPKLPELCGTCRERFEKNPLRVLDCKVPSCHALVKDAPRSLDHLCDDCKAHFETLKAALDALSIPYIVDTGIVRGLDYYTRTVFEIIAPNPEGGEITACGGGRYDGLIEELGGQPTPACGFGMGIERLLLALEGQGKTFEDKPLFTAYVATLGEEARLAALPLVSALRSSGVAADSDHCGRSLKAQFKYAGKLNVPYVIVIGGDELAKGLYTLRDMRDKSEASLTPEQIVERLASVQ